MADPLALIERYVAGELTQDEWSALSQWLSSSETNRQLFLEQVDFYRVVRGVLIEEQRELAKQAEASGSGVFDPETLKALLDIQAAAEDAPLVRIEPKPKTKAPRVPMAKITPGMVMMLFPKRYVYRGLAAAILLAIALITLIQVIGPAASPDLAQNPQTHGTTQPDTPASMPTAVATLTASHNAQWAQTSLARGSDLHAGERLTLTAGFAEITTLSGAVAILEAPATVELLDHNNALRLHAGKLVGICVTDSSKGFLVRTPHMDITDLGTRFGVDVNKQAMTEVHVIQGSVEVSSFAQGQTSQRISQRLTSGYAMVASADDPRIRSVTYEPNRFSEAGLRVTALAGTGLGLKPGEVDVNWHIVAIDGNRLDQPQVLCVNKLHRRYAKPYPNDPATSQWISWEPPGLPIGQREDVATAYHFQTRVELPASFNPATDRVVARCMADDMLQSIAVNGQAVEVPYQKAKDDLDAWFKESYEIVIDHQLVAGQNTIEFVLLNGHKFRDHVGLRVAWELQTHHEGLAPQRGQ